MQGREATTGMLLLLFATLFLSTCDGSCEREASPHTAASVMESALLSTGLKGAHKIQSHARLTEETVHEQTETSNITLRFLHDLLISTNWTGLDHKAGRSLLDTSRHQLSKKYKIMPPISSLVKAYNDLVQRGVVEADHSFSSLLIRKSCRSWSGVLVVTLFTAPGPFSCPMDCHYCPNEVDENGTQLLPRSYLSTEPGCKRGMANNWDCVEQFRDRVSCLRNIGHKVDKIEVLVLGGTWSFYPEDYQKNFIRDIYYAANTLDDPPQERRLPLEIKEEQKINEGARYKVIGITLETRPDFITRAEIRRFRSYGCTRVQVGLQHTNDTILEIVNRKCTHAQGMKAIKLLKDNCFKVDIHLMPDLPGASPQIDREMLEKALFDPDMDADYYKIYPTTVTPFTKIAQWYHEGLYKPYADRNDGTELVELLIWFKQHIQEWKRINRIPRDIPNQSILGGNNKTNLRQIISSKMRQQGLSCRCIRCREIKNSVVDLKEAVLVERTHFSSGGLETFISFETPNFETLLGFVRLRINGDSTSTIFPELLDAALIRELHVYGVLVPTYEDDNLIRPQHVGFGRRLMARAERLAWKAGKRKVAVISGVGVRQYYASLGYHLEGEGEYMVKYLNEHSVLNGFDDEPAFSHSTA